MKKIKRYLYAGVIVNDALMSFTTPMIHIFFIKQLSSSMFILIEWISILFGVLFSFLLQKETVRKYCNNLFTLVFSFDVVCFSLISICGLQLPTIRFIGMAVLNASTTIIWITIVNANINSVLSDDTLTDFQTKSKWYGKLSQAVGATFALVVANYISIEVMIILQISAQIVMATFDYLAIKSIKSIFV